MNITKIVNRDKPNELPVQLGPAHKALLEVVSSLILQAAKGAPGNPIVKLFAGVLPSMERDIARIPEDELKKVCQTFSDKLAAIAQGGDK